jgi:hypothetical protein
MRSGRSREAGIKATPRRWQSGSRRTGSRTPPELRSGDAAHEIIAAAEAHKVDLVVTGSRCLHALGRWLLGSVARKVLLPAATSVADRPPEGHAHRIVTSTAARRKTARRCLSPREPDRSADALVGARVDEHLRDPRIQPADLVLDRDRDGVALRDRQIGRDVDVQVDADVPSLAP